MKKAGPTKKKQPDSAASSAPSTPLDLQPSSELLEVERKMSGGAQQKSKKDAAADAAAAAQAAARARKASASLDMDNVVIPAEFATTRIDTSTLEVKEIPTPTWRSASSSHQQQLHSHALGTPSTPQSGLASAASGVFQFDKRHVSELESAATPLTPALSATASDALACEDDGASEDLSDEAFARRHEAGEEKERLQVILFLNSQKRKREPSTSTGGSGAQSGSGAMDDGADTEMPDAAVQGLGLGQGLGQMPTRKRSADTSGEAPCFPNKAAKEASPGHCDTLPTILKSRAPFAPWPKRAFPLVGDDLADLTAPVPHNINAAPKYTIVALGAALAAGNGMGFGHDHGSSGNGNGNGGLLDGGSGSAASEDYTDIAVPTPSAASTAASTPAGAEHKPLKLVLKLQMS